MKTYEEIGAEIGRLVQTKQEAYGDSFSKSGAVMQILYPDGIGVEHLDDALTMVRVLDKLFRIATDRDALGESPWRDIAGYALLSVKRVEGEPLPEPEADYVTLSDKPVPDKFTDEDVYKALQSHAKRMNERGLGPIVAAPPPYPRLTTCGALARFPDGRLAPGACILGDGHFGNHVDDDEKDWAWDARFHPPGDEE